MFRSISFRVVLADLLIVQPITFVLLLRENVGAYIGRLLRVGYLLQVSSRVFLRFSYSCSFLVIQSSDKKCHSRGLKWRNLVIFLPPFLNFDLNLGRGRCLLRCLVALFAKSKSRTLISRNTENTRTKLKLKSKGIFMSCFFGENALKNWITF